MTEDYVIFKKSGAPLFLEYDIENNKVLKVSNCLINFLLGQHIDEVREMVQTYSNKFSTLMTASEYYKKFYEKVDLNY